MPTINYNLDQRPPHQQRRPQNAQDDAWIRDFLRTAPIGHIATRWGDQPFITPSTFWYDEASHRIVFHSNVLGRVRANSEQHEEVCLEASRFGSLLPSNIALEFSVQYESVVVFGKIQVVEEIEAKREALYGLIGKYFTEMKAGAEYRPITDTELLRTSVYAIAVTHWSGKRNWADAADQSDEWPIFEGLPIPLQPSFG